jgi:large subunit ribosomal protein L24
MQKIKTGDEVIVLVGRDKGKRGKILKRLSDRVLVEGINRVKKHQKPNPNAGIAGGIIEKDMPIHISNVGIYNPETKKADRIGIRQLEDGRKVRFYKSNKETIDV